MYGVFLYGHVYINIRADLADQIQNQIQRLPILKILILRYP